MNAKPLPELLRRVGMNQSELARRLRINRSNVSHWLRSRVPAERVLEIERASGISRYDLRPDIYPPSPERGDA